MAAVFQRFVAQHAADAEIHQRDGNQHGIDHLVQRRAAGVLAVAQAKRGQNAHGDDEAHQIAAAVVDDAPGGVGAEVEPEGVAGKERQMRPGHGKEHRRPQRKQQIAVDAARRGVIRPRGQRGHEKTDETRACTEVEKGKGVPVQREMPGVLRREQKRQPRQERHPRTETGEREKEAEGVFGVTGGEDVGGGHGCVSVFSEWVFRPFFGIARAR